MYYGMYLTVLMELAMSYFNMLNITRTNYHITTHGRCTYFNIVLTFSFLSFYEVNRGLRFLMNHRFLGNWLATCQPIV